MTIRVQCENCEKKLKIPDKFGGKQIKCPSCKASLVVPDPEADKEDSLLLQPVDLDLNPSADAEEEAHTDTPKKKPRRKRKATVQIRYEEEQARAEEDACTIGGGILKSFSYPLTGGGITFIVVAAISSFAALFLGCLGIPIVIAAVCGGLMYTLRQASAGPGRKLNFPADMGALLWPGVNFVLVMFFSYLPLILTIFFGIGALVLGAGANASRMQQQQTAQVELTPQQEAQLAQAARMLRKQKMPEAQIEMQMQEMRSLFAQSNNGFATGSADASANNTDLTPEQQSFATTMMASGVVILGLMVISFFIGLLYFTMAIAQVAKYDSVWAANPVIVFRSILTIPGDYIICTIVFFCVYLGSSIITSVISSIAAAVIDPTAGPYLAYPLTAGIFYYLMAVAFTNLGFMCFRNEEKLGW